MRNDRESLDALISLVRDRQARVDERDDAAIDLGRSSDPDAIAVLLEVGSSADENVTILASCGESLAQIAVRAGSLDRTWAAQLAPAASHEFIATMRAERPDLLEP